MVPERQANTKAGRKPDCCGSGSNTMTIRRRRIQLAALLLAIAHMNSGIFPRISPGLERASPQSRVFNQSDSIAYDTSAMNSARPRLPLTFEANRGQADADVEFVGRADAFALLLKRNSAVLSLRKPQQRLARAAAPNAEQSNGESAPQLLTMKLEGANTTPRISGEARQEAQANYFIGNDPAKWIRHVETYSRVLYSSVYRGVDLVFYGNERQLEYDFTVAPGGDPRAIKLRFEGADDIELDSDGSLVLHTAAGPVTHHRPVAYQQGIGSRLDVPAEFKRLDDGTVGFAVGSYDPALPLVIDPVLVYSTYLGGSAADFCRGIVADSNGNLFLVGDSFSSTFLTNASPTNSDVFLGKLSSNGLLLTYTFFGGSNNDTATGLSVDSSGNLYMGGTTESPDFPIFNSVGQALLGASDAFAVRLTPAADQFFYSNLIGGSGAESGVSIAADSNGSAYITGRTSSQDFPIAGAIQPVYGGGDSDAFVAKLAPDGKTLSYASLLGGSGNENQIGRTGISVDASGNAYVTGDTQSTDFPTRNALRATKNGAAASSDGFVAKINPSGSDFVYATYLGGTEDDFALAIGLDQAGSAFVTGRTKSASFTGSSATRPLTITSDAFVARIDAAGTALTYLTFVGGANGDETGNAIAVDSSGNAVIAGSAGSGSPTVNSVQSFSRGNLDAFVAKLGTNGVVTFSTYLGGSNEDTALAVGVDGTGAIYLAGFTDSTDFLTAIPLVRHSAGGRDIFIAKIDIVATVDSPVLLLAVISGKHLLLYGQGFDPGAKLRINDEQVKTRNEDPDPTQVLFAKKGARRIEPGQTVQLQVVNPNGKRSNFFFLTKPE
jgi:beta-propeller repeat-containing protein